MSDTLRCCPLSLSNAESRLAEAKEQIKALRMSLKGADSSLSNNAIDSLRAEISMKESLLGAREAAVNELTDGLHREKAAGKRLRADLAAAEADLEVAAKRQNIQDSLLQNVKSQLLFARGVISKLVSSIQMKSSAEEALRAAGASFCHATREQLQILVAGLESFASSYGVASKVDDLEIIDALEAEKSLDEQLIACERGAQEELVKLGTEKLVYASESVECTADNIGTQVATDQQVSKIIVLYGSIIVKHYISNID